MVGGLYTSPDLSFSGLNIYASAYLGKKIEKMIDNSNVRINIRDINKFELHSSLGLLARFNDQSLVNVGDHTSASNGGLDQSVQLLVSSDG